MSSRKASLENNELYHIYNRGVDKRKIFSDKKDLLRFFESLKEFNTQEPIGSLYEKKYERKNHFGGSTPKKEVGEKLVSVIAFCLNPNHFHFILKQNIDKGIEKLMHKIGTGYTGYFNIKNKRSGSLFQGRFKSKHIDNNEHLLYLSAYVNLNDKIHGIDNEKEPSFSSFKEYTENIKGVCEKSIILDQYKNKQEYKKSLENLLPELIRQKEKEFND